MAMPDIRQLRAFVAVAEELNFHRAAERLGTVQPALSRLIRNLEEDLKVQLFERTTRHVVLTEPGKTFLGEARAVIGQLTSAVRATRQSAEGTAGTLTLAYMDFAVHRLLPEMLSAVAAGGPDIRIALTYMATARQRLALLEGQADMGLMIGEMKNPHADSILVAAEPVTVVLPERHRLAAKRMLRLKDLAGEAVLLGSEADWSAFRNIIFDLYAGEGSSPKITYEASSAAALLGLVAQGLGITYYAGTPKLYQCKDIVFRPLAPRHLVPISVAWRKGVKAPLVRQVLKLAGWGQRATP